MRYTYVILLIITLFSSSCKDPSKTNLNGDWELIDRIDSQVSEPIKWFRIENDSVLTSIYRGYYDLGEGRIRRKTKEVLVSTGYEVIQFDLLKFDSNTIVFTPLNNPETRYTARRIL